MDNQIFLGSKAYFLKSCFAWLPYPPGFVITTEVFRRREAILQNPYIDKELDQMINRQVAGLEKLTGQQFGNPANPLMFRQVGYSYFDARCHEYLPECGTE